MAPYPRWQNQDIALFHGTTLPSAQAIVTYGIDIHRGQQNREFGHGFYCTTQYGQAAEWARRKAIWAWQRPALVKLAVPRELLASLMTLAFVSGSSQSSDFWSLVHFCREGGEGHSRQGSPAPFYDVVFGPLTQWPFEKIYQGADQVSFHTITAQNLLNTSAQRSIIEL